MKDIFESFLDAQLQDGGIYVWGIVNDKKPLQKVKFTAIGTGWFIRS